MSKTKEAICESAIKVFSERGYKGATMDEIAIVAGVAKGTLYYNFNSKEEIFNYIIQRGINSLREKINDTKESSLDEIKKLKKICKIQLTMFFENRDFFKVLLSQLWGLEERQNLLRSVIKDYVDDIKVIIDEAIKNGYIKSNNSSILAHTFFGSITSTAIYDLIEEGKEDFNKIIETTLEFTLRGLGVQNI